jgi:hypothetical protein
VVRWFVVGAIGHRCQIERMSQAAAVAVGGDARLCRRYGIFSAPMPTITTAGTGTDRFSIISV